MGFLSDMSKIGEQKVFLSTRKLISNSQSASRMLDRVLRGSSNIDKIHALKSNSYEEVFNLSNSITSGAIAPNVIPDMLQLINLEYNIVDMIFILARSLTRYRIKNAAQRKYVTERINATNELVAKALAAIYIMHTEDRLDNIKRLRSQVKLIEEQGDEIKEEMLSYAYSSRMDFKTFYHITNLAFVSDDVLDSCEDTADMLLNIMLAIVT